MTGTALAGLRDVEVETARRCNRSCSWCPNGHSGARKEQELMPWPLFDRITSQLGDARYSGWFALHNYTEPFVVTGRISLDRFVELTSINAARLFGLSPRKGTIAVGSDADLALWDADKRVIDGAQMHSRAGYWVYDGWTVRGWPRFVIRRGQVVLADGTSQAQPGRGQRIPRARAGEV
jgi:hypothetical protein